MRNFGSNTFGERTHYVPVAAEGAARRAQGCSKTMYASPFNEAERCDAGHLPPAEEPAR